MSVSWPKVIRDPVHDIIPFEDTPCDRLLLDLVNTKEFQRLRRIKQLGVSELVFPGANHSRFAHSIGVMHTARSFLAKVRRVQAELLDSESEIVVLAAALIHDVGHGPFSHAFESVTNERHEVRTREIVRDESTELNRKLRAFNSGLPERIAVVLDEDADDAQLEAVKVPRVLTRIVSSQLDADRFDYLLRDSKATGVDYGNFDLRWLIHHLELDPEKGRFFLSHKALSAAEDYIFARYHMYRTVYYHKTTRSAEVMLRLLFKKFKELVSQVDSPEEALQIVPGAPTSVVMAFANSLRLEQYLSLDDHAMTEFLKCCSDANDPSGLLRDLSNGLPHRRLFKAIDASNCSPNSVVKFSRQVVDVLRSQNRNLEYAFADDDPADTPYKPYDPDDENPATQIYINAIDDRPREISTQSEAIGTLKKQYRLLRYYFPETLRDDISAIAKTTLL